MRKNSKRDKKSCSNRDKNMRQKLLNGQTDITLEKNHRKITSSGHHHQHRDRLTRNLSELTVGKKSQLKELAHRFHLTLATELDQKVSLSLTINRWQVSNRNFMAEMVSNPTEKMQQVMANSRKCSILVAICKQMAGLAVMQTMVVVCRL